MVDTPSKYHLSEEELDRRFVSRVRRFVFEGRTPSTDPVIVFLGAQPAAGKSRSQWAVLRRHPEMVELTGDDLRQFHPAYNELMEHDALAMAEATAQASGAWVTRSIDYAYKHNYSLLLEGIFRDPQMTLDTMKRFAERPGKGYRTEVVVLATREDRSRLDKVTRYLEPGHPAPRWASESSHDRGYRMTPVTVQACEDAPHLCRMTVTNRAGVELYDNQRGPDGQWSRSPGAAEALRRGRSLSPDRDEARGWLAAYRRHSRTVVDLGELNGTTLPTFEKLHADADRNADFAYATPDDAGTRKEHTQAQRVMRSLLDSASSSASPDELREQLRQADSEPDGKDGCRMPEDDDDPFRIHNQLFDEKGFRRRSTPEEREERMMVKGFLNRIIAQYRSRWYRASGKEEVEIDKAMALYEEELRMIGSLSPEDRRRIIREYPEIIQRLELEDRE